MAEGTRPSEPPEDEAHSSARILELEQQRAALIDGLVQVRSDIERVADSTAWRLGHGLTGAWGRLRGRGRPPRTEGAVARALSRLDQLARIEPRLAGSAAPARAGQRMEMRRLYERWGPVLRREWRMDLLEGRREWSDRSGPHIGLAGTRGSEPRWRAFETKLAGLGWSVTCLPPEADQTERCAPLDYLLVTDGECEPRGIGEGVVVLAWIEGDPGVWLGRPWIDRLDLALVESEQAAQRVRDAGAPAVLAPRGPAGAPVDPGALREILRRHEQTTSFCVKIGAPDQAAARRGGDLYFSGALRAELRRRGHPCRIQTQAEWEAAAGLQDDVVLHLRGRGRYRPKPGQFNVLWNISHPGELSPPECDLYDLVCVASSQFAEELRGLTRTPVIVLEQATDPRVFFPEPDPRFAHELAFVGNSRGVRRRILQDLIPTPHDLAVYGSDWEGILPSALVVSGFISNHELHRVYSSAAIVLCDHWDDMRDHGFVSNRVFDALACGAVVLCDDVPGLAELFGEGALSYRSAKELHELVERLLADPQERAQRAGVGREMVLSRHTFAHRVDRLLAEIERVGPTLGRSLPLAAQ